MKRLAALAVISGVLSGCAPMEGAIEPDSTDYQFTLDGKPFTPEFVYLAGETDHPQPGDLVRVDRLLLTLGPERACHFVTTPEEDGRLLLKLPDGQTRVVGAQVRWTFRDDKQTIFNPLDRLSAEEIRGLWGVYLDAWPEGVEEKLGHLDPARACVTVTDNVASERAGKMPSLPAGVRYLNVLERSNQGIRDYGAMGRLSELRFLAIRAMTADAIDARLIAGNRSLRYLALQVRGIEDLASLSQLEQVEWLKLPYVSNLETVEFAAKMPKLKRLDVSGTAVRDLSPLGGLEKLEEVVASMTPVQTLPDRPLPALRTLEVFSTQLTGPAVAAFAKRNPECRILFGWGEAFRQAVAGTTRIRVRSGGTCHRQIELEKTLFEVKDKAQIREVIDHIDIDEKQSGFHCMCCGEPSFEFYEDDRLVTTLGFHHGRSVRWPDRWPGDGMLTPKSAVYLVRWLSDNGVTGPLEERQAEEGRRQAMKRRVDRYMAILPANVLDGLRKAGSSEEAAAAFKKGVPDATQRTLLYLRLFGCDNASWNLYAGLDEPLQRELLPAVDAKTLAAAIEKGAEDPAAVNGAARWVFWEDKADSLGPALEGVLPKLAKAGLSHPRKENRRHTLLALGRLRSPGAVGILGDFLAGKILPRELPEGEESEPGGSVLFKPRKNPELENCSDQVCAAFLLAEAGDKQSLPAIRALLETATPDERKVLQEAIAKLESPDK